MMAALEDEPPPLVADEQPASAEGQPTSADEQPRPAVKEQYVPADTQPANAAKHHSDTDSSSDGDESDAEQEPAPAAVEWLATGREKRSTAGNRLKHMLAAQEPDDELELLFAEDGDDAAFSEADEDGSDLHMDSSSDEEDAQGNGGGGDDDLEGEKELERKARENRQATRKRKAQEAIPLKFRKKKVKIAAENSPLVTSRLSAAANRPGAAAALAPRLKKKSERTSWLPTTGEMPTRASRRETTMMSKEQLHQQMIEREVKRIKQVEAMERKAKKMEALRKPPKTQAERLADAAVIEKRNAKSLNRWEEAEKQREEERRAKLAALNNRTLDGPVVTFWSGVGEWVDGKLKYVGKVVTIEEKPPKKKRGTEPDGEDTLRGTSEDVVMTEISAAEKAQAEESSLMVKSIAKGTGASQIASDEAAAPTKLPELPVTSTRDVGAQQETPAGAAQEAPMDMPYTATTSADESTSQQPQQLAPSEPEPQQAVVETDSRPSTTPNLPTSGSADTKPASLHAMEVSDSKRPEALATSESHEVEISPSAAPQSTGDMQASSTLIFDPPDQDTAMRGTEATKINTAVMTAPELEIKSSSSEAPHPQKPEDVDMQGAGDTVTTVAAIKIPPLVSDSTLQHPDLQTSSINTPGLAAYVEGTYTTMGFAPPSQLASTNPPDLGSHSPSFLARPVGISPGGLSIPQIGQFPTPGVPQSGLAPPQGDVDHQPPSLVSQVPLAPTPVIIAAKPVGQGGQPIVPNPTPGAEPNGFPTTSIHALAPLVAPKPVKPRGGRQKKEQEKEKEAETPPPPEPRHQTESYAELLHLPKLQRECYQGEVGPDTDPIWQGDEQAGQACGRAALCHHGPACALQGP
ncbi:vacuolar protein sorting-associated protein 72 [Microdochium nivale]|nr:vacuolar protein sorting-associated protein 72 [Microdochium nivale]